MDMRGNELARVSESDVPNAKALLANNIIVESLNESDRDTMTSQSNEKFVL